LVSKIKMRIILASKHNEDSGPVNNYCATSNNHSPHKKTNISTIHYTILRCIFKAYWSNKPNIKIILLTDVPIVAFVLAKTKQSLLHRKKKCNRQLVGIS
jgi:hypothetical protein